MNKNYLNNLSISELENIVESLGFEKFRSQQIFLSIHKNRIINIDEMKGLKREQKMMLSKFYSCPSSEIAEVFCSKLDDTKKILIHLQDGNIIETVLMKYEHGYSQCLSTQVGCRMGCTFCASTKNGLIRQLEPFEILDQVYLIERFFDLQISNIVLMGSGEPFDNWSNVGRFIELISHEKGKNISRRAITLSTCGVVPGIDQLTESGYPIGLSISLHSPFDEKRSVMMPVGKSYPLDAVFASLRRYQKKSGRRITFEYTLIDGINNRMEDALELKKLTDGLICHINLIPLNPINEYNKNRPDKNNILSFKKILETYGLNVTIRRELGKDISASCGQLRANYLKEG